MKTAFHRFLFGTSIHDNQLFNAGWLFFRLHLGLSIAIHAGWPKMNTLSAPGWFNNQVAGLGFTFPSPAFWATLASWGEFAGGICIAIGFLTRFNAIQLAFQFFVISFLWYDNPEPLTGMYFQNTLFMGFVLVAVGGGGKYAIDKRIRNRKRLRTAAPAKIIAASVFLLMATGGQAQRVKGRDLKLLEGEWKGQLVYLDYSSNKEVTIPVNAAVTRKGKNDFELALTYTNEPSHNGTSLYKLNKPGNMLNNNKLTGKTRQADGSLKLIFEENGTDGNDAKPATFQHEWIIGRKRFIITKRVRLNGEGHFFQRHHYSFGR